MRGPIWMFVVAVLACDISLADDQQDSTQPAATERATDQNSLPVPIDPPEPAAVDGAIERGIGFLLEVQNADGSWGSATRTKGLNIYAPVPGAHHAFRAAVTAMCVSALIETGSGQKNAERAIERGETWLFDRLPKLRRATPAAIYNVWGHIYSIQALARMRGRHPDDEERQKRIRSLIESQFEMLQRYESVDGGWGYYDFHVGSQRPASSSTSFVSAAALVAFDDARSQGIYAPQKMVDRAVASIKRQQKPDFSYLYGEYLKWYPVMGINRPGGSLGRSQACNIALRLWGDSQITDRVLKEWLNRLFTRNGWLDMGRKRPIPHESWFQVAGYFYYFGHYYAALCLEQLRPADRPPFQAHLALLMLQRQEKDGSWWDYPLYNYHQQYGTAFALMTLKRCRETEPEPD